MKKIVSLLMVGLLFSFCACATNEINNTSTDSQQSSSEVEINDSGSNTEMENPKEDSISSIFESSSVIESNEEEDSGDDSLNCERPSDREMKLFCDLQMKEYDINDVTCTISYGAWEEWDWLYNAEDEHNVQKQGALLYIQNHSRNWREGGTQYLINATQNVGLPPADYMQIKKIISLSELRENYTFQYDVEGNVIDPYAERLTIPTELFNEDEGGITITFVYYTTYQWDYQVGISLIAAGNFDVMYKKQGGQVLFSGGKYHSGL